MYNSITEEIIKQIPQIGEIDTGRLPQELTRIYAQIVSLRRQLADGTLNFQSEELISSLNITETLANNLETILVLYPNHEKKESIAFVAATAHVLLQKINNSLGYNSTSILEIDSISTHISCIVLFLIGNSQADAAEMANHLFITSEISLTKQKLVSYIQALGKGNLDEILNNPITEEEIENKYLQEVALDYLWREIGLGIYSIAERLTSKIDIKHESNFFNRVIDLSSAEDNFLNQKSTFAGPYHLAKLLRILEGDILNRAVINIPTPNGVDAILWESFLEKLAKERPYLWENHKDAVDTNFLDPGISSVLTLPTGAGKSTLSELKIASCLYSGRKVIYLVPTHALEDQVNKNLKNLFSEFEPDNIEFDGEFTEIGDIDSFPILVMTPERCLTLLNMSPDFFNAIGLIVFDEFHLINGKNIQKDRRAVDAMYCLVSLFTIVPKSDFLLISAMVENGLEIAEWIQTILGRECKLFNSSWKPTRQLHGCLVFEEKEITTLTDKIRKAFRVKKTKFPPVILQRDMGITPHCFFSLKNIWETNDDNDYYRIQLLDENILLGLNSRWNLTTNRNDIAAKLGSHFSKLGLKTLIFVDDPRIANSTAQKINESLNDRINSHSAFIDSNAPIIESLSFELGSIENSYFQNHFNVGVHHGLLLPLERSLIEQYFKQTDGSIALVATATLAQGINLPAEIVIIAGDDRYNDDLQYRERIPPHELLNAAGRAGRAGQSSQGAVILIPGEIVTIKDSTISDRWWTLKNEVFSKSDQCLKVEDPLEYFLDSIQDETEPLDVNQTNILYRFKAENLSETETKNLFKNSFYAYKAVKENKEDTFSYQVENLIKRRTELDNLSENIVWTKEVSFKTGIDPSLVLELSNAIDKEELIEIMNFSVIQYIDWFLGWLSKDTSYLNRIFTKPSTINQLKRAIGIRPEIEETDKILEKLPTLRNLLLQYINGESLQNINQSIVGPNEIYLTKARNFSIRLIPEISFSFGFLSMVIIEKALQQSIERKDIPWTLKALASCVREGFDEVEKLFFKRNKQLKTRVETHTKYLAAKK